MSTSTDVPRVRMGHAAPADDGVLLTLMTTAGVEVKFLLDDLALGLLGITLNTAMRAEEQRLKGDKHAVRIFKKENNDSE